jgi:hypothetical protein
MFTKQEILKFIDFAESGLNHIHPHCVYCEKTKFIDAWISIERWDIKVNTVIVNPISEKKLKAECSFDINSVIQLNDDCPEDKVILVGDVNYDDPEELSCAVCIYYV